MPLNCEDLIRQALGRDMREEEILDFARDGARLARQARAGQAASGRAPDMAAHAARWAERKKLAILARQRAEELQASARLAALRQVRDNFAGMEWEGVSALMVGGKHNRKGARLSVDSLRSSLGQHYLGSLVNELERLGPEHVNLLRKGVLDREIARALWSLGDAQLQYHGPAEAMEIAEVIHKWQEKARVDENNAGAWINALPGYIVRQSHDQLKIKRAGFEQWKADIETRLDWDRTADGRLAASITPADILARDQFLEEVYTGFITGIHEKFTPPGMTPRPDPLVSSATMGATAARASKQRVLHFRDGDAWFEYNGKYGRGQLVDGVISGLTKSANDTALMRVFGPSPRQNLQNMVADLNRMWRARQDDASIRQMRKMQKRLDNQMKELDGSLNMEGNPDAAQVASLVRAVESMSKLGGALISGFSDVPLMAQEFYYQGRGFFSALSEGLSLLVRGRGTLEQREIIAQCGVFCDSMIGNLTSRFAGNELPGKASAMMNVFFKLNGLSWWTDSWRKSATLMMSHDLAGLRHQPWNLLPHQRRRVLSLYHIDEGLWEMLRKGQMQMADGRDYFTPDLAFQIGKSELQGYMNGKGLIINDQRVELFREEIASRLRAYFRDRVQYAVLEPDARTASIVHQGLAAGTPAGEALRFCMQFKSFPAVFLQRALGREIYGRGSDTLAAGLRQAIIPRGGEITGLMGMVAMTTVFGYVSMCAKQLLAGKNPRDFTQSPEDFAKVMTASLVQGGGLGILGDFLFGEKSRMGDGFLSTMAGPAMGSLSSIVSLYQSARDGEDVRATAFRTLWSHVPGNNLYWTRAAVDNLLLNSMYELMNPGYLKRMRRRVEKENNQTFWCEPHTWSWAR